MQRNSKLVILDNLGMPAHTHLIWKYHFEKIFDIYQQPKKINFVLHVFLEILQRYCKFGFGTFGMSGYAHPKWYYHLVENVFIYLQAKNQLQFPMLLWRYCKDMQTYFGYFWHAWLHSPKMIVSTCRRLPCLSACKK